MALTSGGPPSKTGTAAASTSSVTGTTGGHLAGVPEEPETGDVGARVHREAGQRLGRSFVQGTHRGDGLGHQGLGRPAPLDGGADDAGAQGLGEEQDVPGPGAGVGPDTRRVDGPRHGVLQFNLLVAHGVPAEQGDTGSAELVEAAQEDLPDRLGVEALVGEAGDGQGGRGRPPMADVADGVRGGNLSVEMGSWTIGVKKSTVCTSAGPDSSAYTPASSAVLKSTRTRGSVWVGMPLNT